MNDGLVQFHGCCLAPELGQLRPLGSELEDEDRIQVDSAVEVAEVGEWVHLRKAGWFFGVSVPRWLWQTLPGTSCERAKDIRHIIERQTGVDRLFARRALLYLEAWQILHVRRLRRAGGSA